MTCRRSYGSRPRSASRSIPTRTAERPILLAVDSAARRRSASSGPPELSNPVASIEVGEHEDEEKLTRARRAASVGLHGDARDAETEARPGTFRQNTASSRRRGDEDEAGDDDATDRGSPRNFRREGGENVVNIEPRTPRNQLPHTAKESRQFRTASSAFPQVSGHSSARRRLSRCHISDTPVAV